MRRQHRVESKTDASPQGETTIRRVGVDDWQLWRKLRLEALREAPYAFSSTLAEWQGKGDTENRWRERLSDVPFNIVAEWQKIAAGMAGGTAPDPDGSVELRSMWVAPFARGQGVGDSLVNAVIGWAREQRALRVELAVFGSNERAISLYRRHGFVDIGATVDNGVGTTTELKMAHLLESA